MAIDEFFCDSTTHTNGVWKVGTVTLASGVTYRVTVDGNWTAWSDINHPNEIWRVFNLGAGDFVEPKYHAPGRNLRHTQWNPEWRYADFEGTVPRLEKGVRISLDGGATEINLPDPIGGPGATWDATNHVYSYSLVGQGHPLRARFFDQNKFDNDGMMKFTVGSVGGGWKVGVVAWGGGGIVDAGPILVPFGATGWKYQTASYATGGDPYAHSTAFAQPEFDDSSWATGQAPFGSTATGGTAGASANTYAPVQGGIKIRRVVVVAGSQPLELRVRPDNLAYSYWNGELIDFYDNSFQQWQERLIQIPANKVNNGQNTLALMLFDEAYDYGSQEGTYFDVELRKT